MQNTQSSGAVNATLTYANGLARSTSIPAGGSTFFFTSADGVSDGWVGPAEVSANGNIAVAVGAMRTQASGTRFAAYSGFIGGSTQVSLPSLLHADAGFNSIVLAQNVGASTANITLHLSGSAVNLDLTINVAAGGLAVWTLATENGLPAGWSGSGTLMSSEQLIAVVANDNDANLTAGDLLRVFRGLP